MNLFCLGENQVKFKLVVILTAEELHPRNSTSIDLDSPYPRAALALRMLASS